MIARRKKEVDVKEFYKEFLRHTCNSLPNHRRLTDKEIDVLTEFWALEGDLVKRDRFSTSVKRYIREDVFNYKNYANLENYLASLIKKGFIQKSGKKMRIRPSVDLSKDILRKNKVVRLIYEFNIID